MEQTPRPGTEMATTPGTAPLTPWTTEDNQAEVKKYGVLNYEGTAKFKIVAPARPTTTLLPPTEPAPECERAGEFF